MMLTSEQLRKLRKMPNNLDNVNNVSEYQETNSIKEIDNNLFNIIQHRLIQNIGKKIKKPEQCDAIESSLRKDMFKSLFMLAANVKGIDNNTLIEDENDFFCSP